MVVNIWESSFLTEREIIEIHEKEVVTAAPKVANPTWSLAAAILFRITSFLSYNRDLL
jgi:hypothetical protein